MNVTRAGMGLQYRGWVLPNATPANSIYRSFTNLHMSRQWIIRILNIIDKMFDIFYIEYNNRGNNQYNADIAF